MYVAPPWGVGTPRVPAEAPIESWPVALSIARQLRRAPFVSGQGSMSGYSGHAMADLYDGWALTMAMMPALIASDSVGQASITTVRSGSFCS
jgi:hypothetical protein